MCQRDNSEGHYPLHRMVSAYAGLRGLGLSAGTAMAAQALVALLAGAAVLAVWRRSRDPRRALGVALLVLGGGSVLGGFVPLIGGSVGRLAGVAAGAFLIGAVAARRRYVETALAGAGVGAASTLLSVLSVGFLPVGVRFLQDYGVGLVGVGATLGALVALIGAYFGRDLRAGLTADVE